MHPENGVLSYGRNACKIILGAKLIDVRKFLQGRVIDFTSAQHLFIKYFENRTRYGLTEVNYTTIIVHDRCYLWNSDKNPFTFFSVRVEKIYE